MIKNYSKQTLRFFLISFVIIQFIDLSKASNYFSVKLNNPNVYNERQGKWQSPMKDIIWVEIGKKYNKVNYVFTSNRPKDYFPISHFAEKNEMKINTGYFSRVSKRGTKIVNQRLKDAIMNKKLDKDTVYFIYDEDLWIYIKKNYDTSNHIIKNIDNFKVLAKLKK